MFGTIAVMHHSSSLQKKKNTKNSIYACLFSYIWVVLRVTHNLYKEKKEPLEFGLTSSVHVMAYIINFFFHCPSQSQVNLLQLDFVISIYIFFSFLFFKLVLFWITYGTAHSLIWFLDIDNKSYGSKMKKTNDKWHLIMWSFLFS